MVKDFGILNVFFIKYVIDYERFWLREDFMRKYFGLEKLKKLNLKK